MSEFGLGIEKGVDFKIPNNQEVKTEPLVSSIHGGELRKKENGLYFSEHDGFDYMVSEEGKAIPLKDPMSTGHLIPNSDGTFLSESTGGKFTFDKGHFIPLYIPDGTGEPAHIKDGMLVGNETGRSFEITKDGVVLTPQEIENRRVAQKISEKLNEFEGEIKQSIVENMKDFGLSLEGIIREFFLGIKTEDQLYERIRELREEYNKRMAVIQDRYETKLKNITEKGLMVELGLEPDLKPKSEQDKI